MKAIFKGNKFVIQWAITDAVTSLPFDFTGMFVDFVLYSDSYHGRISGYTLSGNKMQAEIPANILPVGVYNIVCEYRTRKDNHGHCICRRAFQITRNPECCTGDDTVLIESFAAPLQLDNMDINYIGHYPSGVSLPDQNKPSWALVGTLKEAKPWFFYAPGSVPPGFQAGWNDMSAVLGTYDLTADKVSIYDYHLLTEYNVSRNHVHSTRVFSQDWGVTSKYYSEFADYVPGQHYAACSKVNMPGYKEHSFMANKATKEAPFITVDETNEFSFSEAVALVPEEYRFPGMHVTFINSMTRLAETWYFNGGTWENVGNWQKINFGGGEGQLTAEELFRDKFEQPKLTADMAIADEHGNRIPDTYVTRHAVAKFIQSVFNEMFIANPPLIMEGYIIPEMLSEEVRNMLAAAGTTITNLPDGEDLATIHGVLKFADKEYNPNAYSGLGRRILRKNIVAGVNVLTQSMIQWPNTIYVIQYDYDLQGAEISVPEGCVLDFQGGRLDNGTLICKDTIIKSNSRCFGVSLKIAGDIGSSLKLSMFGIYGNKKDNALIWNNIQISSNTTLIVDSDITFNDAIVLPERAKLFGNNHKFKFENLIKDIEYGLLNLSYRCWVDNLQVYAPYEYSGNIISASTNCNDVKGYFRLTNIYINGEHNPSGNYSSTGISIDCDDSNIIGAYLSSCVFNNIKIDFVGTGIGIKGENFGKDNAYCWINTLQFFNIEMSVSKHGIYLDYTNSASNNPYAIGPFYFQNIIVQATNRNADLAFQTGNVKYVTYISNSKLWDADTAVRCFNGTVILNNVEGTFYSSELEGTDEYGEYKVILNIHKQYGGSINIGSSQKYLDIYNDDYTAQSGSQKYTISGPLNKLNVKRGDLEMSISPIGTSRNTYFLNKKLYLVNRWECVYKADGEYHFQDGIYNPQNGTYNILSCGRYNAVLKLGGMSLANTLSNKEIYQIKIEPPINATSRYKVIFNFVDAENNKINYRNYSLNTVCGIDFVGSFTNIHGISFEISNVEVLADEDLIIYFDAKRLNTNSPYLYIDVEYATVIKNNNIEISENQCIYVKKTPIDYIQGAEISLIYTNYIRGGSDNRPEGQNISIGQTYFDTDLNKSIWWTGSKWVDATGAEV